MLNRFRPDPANLKILILSAPKTGNTWLRWLLHYAYSLPFADIPLVWDEACARTLPPSFVTHQHLPPSEALVRWLVRNDVVVLTTIRHPADTFLSYFHYLKWTEAGTDPANERLLRDGERPGRNALKYVEFSFTQVYAVSLAWARLGARVVRYEDLLADPLGELRAITAAISPLDDERLQNATLLCRPEHLTGPGLVDPRHLRTGTARRWISELPSELVDKMAAIQPYTAACAQYGYNWDVTTPAPPRFDYDRIDPFRGRTSFDNGEAIGPTLPRIYLYEVADARRRWPDPISTEGDSFWNWLRSPALSVENDALYLSETLTNLMRVVYKMRSDLWTNFPDIAGRDRMAFVNWFVGRAQPEFELPWALVEPVQYALCDQIASSVAPERPRVAGQITALSLTVPNCADTAGIACDERITVDLEFSLEQPVDRPVIGLSLRNFEGGVLFGTNSTALGTPLPALPAGKHRARLACRLTIPPQRCSVAVGLACFQPDGTVEPIHRRYDFAALNVVGTQGFGNAWCPTSIGLVDA